MLIKKVCRFCNEAIYIKTVRYSAPLLAPMNDAQALRDKLINMTGEVYVRLENSFSSCGRIPGNLE